MKQTDGSIVYDGAINMTCGNCGSHHTLLTLKYLNYKCKKCSNSGKENFIILDELIAPTILMLNKKGYKTRCSCSGHNYDNTSGYIGFWEKYVDLENIFKQYDFFRFDKDINETFVRWDLKGNNFLEKSECILKIARILYDIAESL